MREDRTPVAAAHVRLRTWDFNDGAAPKRAATAIDLGDTRTDSFGRFRFRDVETGRYAVEVDAGGDGSALLEIDADGTQRVLTLQAMVQPKGALAGAVRDAAGSPILGAAIGLLGLDRKALTDSAGRFILAGLPTGTYTVRIEPPSEIWSPIELTQVRIIGGAGSSLDSLVLPIAVAGNLAHWRFDEGAGTVSADALGSEARAILKGGAAWSAGRIGFALSLSPQSNPYAFIPRTRSAALELKAGMDFTISAWIKTAAPGSGAGASRRVADTRTGYAPNGYALGVAPDGVAELLFRALGDTVTHRIVGGTGMDDGAWHHLAAGRSGTRWFLYADGVLLAESAGTAEALTWENPLYFGSREGLSDFFPGLIDDVRLLPAAWPMRRSRP